MKMNKMFLTLSLLISAVVINAVDPYAPPAASKVTLQGYKSYPELIKQLPASKNTQRGFVFLVLQPTRSVAVRSTTFNRATALNGYENNYVFYPISAGTNHSINITSGNGADLTITPTLNNNTNKVYIVMQKNQIVTVDENGAAVKLNSAGNTFLKLQNDL